MLGWLGAGISVAGVAVILVALWLAYRAGVLRPGRSSALSGMPPQERRTVLRQMRGEVPVSAREAPVVRGVAERMSVQRSLLAWAVGLILGQVGLLIQHHSVSWAVATLVVIALLGVGVGLIYRDVGRARRYLRRQSG
jgi:hypothetical protein